MAEGLNRCDIESGIPPPPPPGGGEGLHPPWGGVLLVLLTPWDGHEASRALAEGTERLERVANASGGGGGLS